MIVKRIALAGLLSAAVAAPAFSEGHATPEQLNAAMSARQAQMQLYSFNLGYLGGVAKGEIAYDAEAAQAAANNLAALSTLSQRGYWLPGTDSDSLEGSRALPAIWEPGSTAQAEGMKLAEASAAMAAVAGDGVEAIQAQMRALGGSCGSCHELYRKPR